MKTHRARWQRRRAGLERSAHGTAAEQRELEAVAELRRRVDRRLETLGDAEVSGVEPGEAVGGDPAAGAVGLGLAGRKPIAGGPVRDQVDLRGLVAVEMRGDLAR